MEQPSDQVTTESFGDVMKAVRGILRVKEGGSLLGRVLTVMRRYDDMRVQLKKEGWD